MNAKYRLVQQRRRSQQRRTEASDPYLLGLLRALPRPSADHARSRTPLHG